MEVGGGTAAAGRRISGVLDASGLTADISGGGNFSCVPFVRELSVYQLAEVLQAVNWVC